MTRGRGGPEVVVDAQEFLHHKLKRFRVQALAEEKAVFLMHCFVWLPLQKMESNNTVGLILSSGIVIYCSLSVCLDENFPTRHRSAETVVGKEILKKKVCLLLRKVNTASRASAINAVHRGAYFLNGLA